MDDLPVFEPVKLRLGLKATSLWQPWATGVALGVKAIETRGRRTSHRGEIAIHAAKRWEDAQRHFAEQERAHGTISFGLPFGAIVAVVDIVEVHGTEELLAMGLVGDQERRWGDYGPKRYGYILSNVRRLSEPVPCKGQQGIWTLDPDIEDLVRARAA